MLELSSTVLATNRPTNELFAFGISASPIDTTTLRPLWTRIFRDCARLTLAQAEQTFLKRLAVAVGKATASTSPWRRASISGGLEQLIRLDRPLLAAPAVKIAVDSALKTLLALPPAPPSEPDAPSPLDELRSQVAELRGKLAALEGVAR